MTPEKVRVAYDSWASTIPGEFELPHISEAFEAGYNAALASQPVPASSDLVERVARELCVARGRDPDRLTATVTSGVNMTTKPGRPYAWELEVETARAIIPIIQADEREAYQHARRLAVALWEKHFRDQSPEWKPLPDLFGVIDQIDNMTTGLALKAGE